MREAQSLGGIQFAALARAGEGLTQWRPLAMGFLTLLLAGATFALSQWMLLRAGVFLGLLVGLLALVIVLAGISGVGCMLMDKAQRQPVRSFGDAAIFGLLCIPKFLGFALLLLAVFLAFMLVAAVVYFVCKIPVLGAVLAFVAHPLLVLVGAALLVALMWVVYPLFAPAIWSGLSFKAALASVVGIARKRIVEVVMMELVLYVVVGVISMLLLLGLLPVSMSLTGMATAIIGVDSYAMRGGFNPMYAFMGLMNSGPLLGLMLGLGVLMAVVGALLGQVMLMGMNLVYLQAQEGVDTSGAEGELDGFIGDVRKRAEEAKERALAAAERAKQAAAQKAQEVQAANEARKAAAAAAAAQAQAQAAEAAQREAEAAAAAPEVPSPAAPVAPVAAPAPAAPAAAPHCPDCHDPVAPQDAFCGNCGHKLK